MQTELTARPTVDMTAGHHLQLLGAPQTASAEPLSGIHGNVRPASLPEQFLRELWRPARAAGQYRIALLRDLCLATFNLSLILDWRILSDQFIKLSGLTVNHTSDAPTFAVNQYPAFLILYVCLVILAGESNDLYRHGPMRPMFSQFVAIAKSSTLVTLLLILILLYSPSYLISPIVLALTCVLNVATFTGWRMWRRYATRRRVEAERDVHNVVIVGAGPLAKRLASSITRNPQLGCVVKGFVVPSPNGSGDVLGTIDDLTQVVRTHFVDEILIATTLSPEQLKNLVDTARVNHLNLRFVPGIYEELTWPSPLDYLGEIPLLSLHREPIPAFALLIKRSMDVLISGIGLIFISPLLLAIFIGIKLDSQGPVLYRSRRMGKKGHRFNCYKFRTMVVNADSLKSQLMAINERQGPFFKISNDPRLTRLGRWLRKFSLDELPQLWNVLIGDMSLVGPRPPEAEETNYYRPEYLRRLDVKPGVTGLWQVTARRDPSFERTMALDIEYIEKWSPWMDCKILLKTVPMVLRGSGQ